MLSLIFWLLYYDLPAFDEALLVLAGRCIISAPLGGLSGSSI